MYSPAVTPASAGSRQQLVDALGLVGGQRVHRVQQDRLDAGLALLPLAAAVVEHRDQERLGLARAGAGGDQRRLGGLCPLVDSRANAPPGAGRA